MKEIEIHDIRKTHGIDTAVDALLGILLDDAPESHSHHPRRDADDLFLLSPMPLAA